MSPVLGSARARFFTRCLALSLTIALTACSNDPAELPESVVVPVGPSGGTVKAKGVSLVIPEGALDKETLISAEKVDMDKIELPKDAKGVSAVYEFGPKGTKFNKGVQVQFDTEKDEPEAKVYFTKEG